MNMTFGQRAFMVNAIARGLEKAGLVATPTAVEHHLATAEEAAAAENEPPLTHAERFRAELWAARQASDVTAEPLDATPDPWAAAIQKRREVTR